MGPLLDNILRLAYSGQTCKASDDPLTLTNLSLITTPNLLGDFAVHWKICNGCAPDNVQAVFPRRSRAP